ncbi:HipA domain-containing protein [Burkholderia sp. Bp8986]|uniref:HipA domain-containing protein n=1 Tax=Burkholderia sp. Bp8986 TaxID=2184550 RepID=UPI000F5AED94|nr:HipA domain-containing protein [Burkholderia sp. Bp8986]RQS43943.1 hypothetical protein DID99_34590 [Burkholderia sp. Bp8986]
MDPVIQPGVIDVTDWPEDPEFSLYPEGAREKSAFFPPAVLPFEFLKPGRRYLFKLSDERYPEQFWAEVIAYIVGCRLGVEVPPAYVAVHRQRQTCGALIEWFFVDGHQTFIAGGNRLQRLLPTYDRKKGEQHSFQLVQRACHGAARDGLLGDWLMYWARAFLFDALIGNTDRHQDNWGFLQSDLPDGTIEERLSPLFDNGTSLGMERHIPHVAGWDDNRCVSYLNKGRHHMKFLSDDVQRCQHYDMVERVATMDVALKAEMRRMMDEFSLRDVEQAIAELGKLELPLTLTKERASFTLRLLSFRYKRLCEILS